MNESVRGARTLRIEKQEIAAQEQKCFNNEVAKGTACARFQRKTIQLPARVLK
jgi:hypothetical protein